MEYLNIKLSTVGDIRFLGSAPIVRATWLQLQIYCTKQENGGLIENCRAWGDGTWAQIAGLRKREAHAASELWTWEGDGLRVWGYNLESEGKVREKRERGRNGGLKSGESRRSSADEATASPTAEAVASPDAQAELQGSLERKEREGNERKETSTTTTTTRGPALNRGCSLDEARDYATTFNAGKGQSSGRSIAMPVVTLWHNEREKVGWITVKGQLEIPIANWQADLESFAQRYAQNELSTPPGRYPAAAPKAKVELTTKPKGGW